MNLIPNEFEGQLIEHSFAEAAVAITAAAGLSAGQKQQWICALRQIARAFGRPLESIPARYSAVRTPLRMLHHAPLQITAKTLANHRSNVKAALLWFRREQDLPQHGVPLVPQWEALRRAVCDKAGRERLSPLFRYCSAKAIPPDKVDEQVIADFLQYRATATARPVDSATRRLLVRAWNAGVDQVSGWPSQRLVEPPVREYATIKWENFPVGLRDDVANYLQGLTAIRRTFRGARIRPLRPSTIKMRQAELQAAARMAAKIVPIESLTSLKALVEPGVATRVLDAYWKQNGDRPGAFTINLAGRLLSIARELKCLDQDEVRKLDDLRFLLDEQRSHVVTEKNLALIRQVRTPGVWSRVTNLPYAMMKEARAKLDHAPIRAAVRGQLAIAIAILSIAPVRLENLTNIRLGFNLSKPDGPNSNYWLRFPDYDVKNRVRLEFPLSDRLTAMIDEYVNEMRPILMRGRNEDWLFPGLRGGRPKQKTSFSGQITDAVQEATGLRVTVQQFRHAAGAIFLQHRPGEYELVRQLLGHRTLETTKRFYLALEGIEAGVMFNKMIEEKLQFEPEDE